MVLTKLIAEISPHGMAHWCTRISMIVLLLATTLKNKTHVVYPCPLHSRTTIVDKQLLLNGVVQRQSAAKQTLACPTEATTHETCYWKVSKCSSSSVLASTQRLIFCYNLCILVCLLSSLASQCHFSQMYFLFSLSFKVVDMLWEHTAHHLLRQAFFPPSSFSSFFLLSRRHSSLGPLGMQTRGSW